MQRIQDKILKFKLRKISPDQRLDHLINHGTFFQLSRYLLRLVDNIAPFKLSIDQMKTMIQRFDYWSYSLINAQWSYYKDDNYDDYFELQSENMVCFQQFLRIFVIANIDNLCPAYHENMLRKLLSSKIVKRDILLEEAIKCFPNTKISSLSSSTYDPTRLD